MIIKDKNGVHYRLGKTKLSCVPKSFGYPPFYIFLADVKKGTRNFGLKLSQLSVQLWLGRRGPGAYVRVPVRERSIGCRKFGKKEMQLIKKAIKEAQRGAKAQRNKA